MNREDLKQYIFDVYSAEPDHPWAEYPRYEVFRHGGSRKWFAVILDVPKPKLGLTEEGILDVVNLKCGPILIGSLRTEPGFFPAYHMSKENWISAGLDGRADEEKIKLLLEQSYRLTAPKGRGRGRRLSE